VSDEDDVWTEDLEAYVQAYAEEERGGVDAAAALRRFNDAHPQAPVPLEKRNRRRHAVVFAMVGAAIAAGLAGVWVSNGRSFQLEANDDSVTLTQDAVEPSAETRAVVPADPDPPRATPPRNQSEPPPPEPEPEAARLEEPEPDPAPREPTRRAPKPSSSPESEIQSSAQPSELSRELTMLSSLRKSARAREYAKTLELVRAHRVEFPKPTLAAERDLIELEALCGLGRLGQVNDAKEAFAKAHPTHHLGAKAEHVCEKKSDRVQNGDGPRHQGE